jgi:hypothetical protein
MSAAGMYMLAPEQYLRVLTSGLTGLLDSIDAGAERDSFRADLDALLLLAYQAQEYIGGETPAARGSKKETPKKVHMFDLATRLEEIKAGLEGIDEGLELVLNSSPSPEPSALLCILRDRLRLELKNLGAQEAAAYALARAEQITAVPS